MIVSRRTSLSLMLAGVASPAAETPAHPAITTGPLLQSPTETSMTVTWITDRNTTAAVEYGPSQGALKTAFSSHDGLIDANERIHKVVLRDLQPGTTYRYRVVSRDIPSFHPYKLQYGETVASAFHEFRTLDRKKSDFSFVVLNDIHDIATTIPDLLNLAADRPYDFVLLNGDILSHIDNEGQITAILNQATSSFASTKPMIWVRGNHETRGGFARQLPQYLASPNGRYYYSFDQGPVHFTVLDAGEDKVDEHAEYAGLVDFFRYRREQAEWLKAEVQTDSFRHAKFRVVICHMPFPSARATSRTPDVFQGMPDAFKNFGATLDSASVDLMISGHMHVAAIIDPEPGRHRYPIVQGGGPKDPGRTIIRVDVSSAKLEATIVRADGSTFGVCRVNAKRS